MTVLIIITVMGINRYTQHNQVVVVPDLYALEADEACNILQRNQLRCEIVDSTYNKNLDDGAIVDQIPKAKSKVKNNRIVFLTVNNLSKLLTPMPSVREISQRQAIAILKAAGFIIKEIESVDYEYKDLVVNVKYNGRDVTPGEKIPSGSNLVLQVGNGFATPEDPDSITETDSDNILDDTWFE